MRRVYDIEVSLSLVLFIVVIVCSLLCTRGFEFPPLMGKYTLKCNLICNCVGGGSGYKIQLSNSTLPSDCGAIHLGRVLANNTMVSYSWYVWIDEKWNEIMSDNLAQGCETMLKSVPEMFTLLNVPTSCPLTSSTYHFQRSTVDGITLAQFPKLPYGRSRLILRLQYTSEADMEECLLFDFNIIP